jgi:hypothetical protein
VNRRKEAPRVVDQPEPSWFQIRLTKGGPWVGARIVRHDDGRWQAVVNGDPEDEGHVDPARASRVLGIWNHGVKISEDDYHILIGKVAWAMANAPDAPEANPLEKIDLNRLRPLWAGGSAVNENETAAGIGDNSLVATSEEDFDPLDFTTDMLPDALKSVFHDYAVRKVELLADADRFNADCPSISDDDIKSRATSVVAQIKKAAKAGEIAHERVKKPFLVGGRHVDAFFKRGIVEPLDAAARGIEAKMTAYDRAIVERKRAEAAAAAKAAAEEAARLAAEAERTMQPAMLDVAIQAATVAEEAAAVASGSDADFSRVHGNYGGVASQRSNWTWEAENLFALVQAAAANPNLLRFVDFNRTAITQAVRGAEKVRDIPGVRIFNDAQTRVKT